MIEIGTTLGELDVCKEETYENLTVFPLVSANGRRLDYLTLGEALAGGVASLSEVSKRGSVPELRFANRAELPVLIIDGEELVGAKQNRVANLTVLVPARTTLVIPVSCVEAGRWLYQRDDFVASERAHFARGRAARVASVSYALESSGSRRSDQGRVWSDISAKAERLQASSPTQAMAAIYDRHRKTVESYVAAITPVEGQTGALFAIDGALVGLDLFDSATTLAALLPKLVCSYAIDAVETAGGDHPAADPSLARAFLERAASARVASFPAIGLGTDIRLAAPGMVGGGLVVDDLLVHLAAFAQEEAASPGYERGSGMAGLRSRRRAYQGR